MPEDTTASETADAELVSTDDAAKALEAGVKGHDLERLVAQREAGVVNPIVLARALGVRPQMIYNYIREGRNGLVGVRENDTQKIVIDWDVAIGFAQRYLNRKAQAELKKQLELAGQPTS